MYQDESLGWLFWLFHVTGACIYEENTFNLAGFSRKFIGTGVILSQKQRAISLSAYPPVNNS